MVGATQLWWYTARSGGIVAWALLTASVLFGLSLSTKVFGKRPRPNWLLDLHRFLGGAAVVFTVVHVVSILLDQFVHFGVADVLVPFASSWKPGAVAWGIVALYLLLAVEITSLLRAHISKGLWRATHYASFPLFVVASIHALTAGTDRNTLLLRYGVIVSAVAVLVLTLIRVDRAEHHDVMTSPPVAPRERRGRIPAR
ncbi:MAG TPA: ferric reductase-like transmembrane domain-containing protein [Acidimicrobiia bacterium]|nr:ferric reductase-like transmembrane domain-containing protein [Acidimicrobiia bacterium]